MEVKIKRKNKHRITAYWIVLISVAGVTALLIGAGFITPFCDWYANHLYNPISDFVTRITDFLPFNLGELMMYLGAFLLEAGAVISILLIFLRKKNGYRKFCGIYFKSFLMALTFVVFIYMPMWYIPFRSTVFGRGDTNLRTEFTYDEIYTLLKYAVDGANAAAEEIEISADGKVDFPTAEEIHPFIVDAMTSLSDEFPRLKGYYPRVKTAYCSDILDRMGIGGYTYPYTMEATHSKYVSPSYLPILDAHELAHHKGYYKENEANLLSEIALTKSENPFLRLSAFCDIYDYICIAYTDAESVYIDELQAKGIISNHELKTEDDVYNFFQEIQPYVKPYPELSHRVYQINHYGYIIEAEIYEQDSHPIDDMPVVNEVIENTADAGWETQGEILGENSYDGVTLLLLQYFDGVLY